VLEALAGAGPATAYGIAQTLGRAPGSIQSVIGRLEREQLIAGSAAGGRTIYTLTTTGEQSLAERDQPGVAGFLGDDVRLLIVGDQAGGPPVDALKGAAADEAVRWAVRLDGAATWIVAVDAADSLASDRLRSAFTAAGASCIAGRVSEVLSPAALAEHAGLIVGRRSLGR
jgi:hypothetical protein